MSAGCKKFKSEACADLMACMMAGRCQWSKIKEASENLPKVGDCRTRDGAEEMFTGSGWKKTGY